MPLGFISENEVETIVPVVAIFFILKPRPNMFGGRANPGSPMYARDDEPDKR